MSWTEHDNVLFSIINTFGKESVEKQIVDNSNKLMALSKTPKLFVVFGIYDLKKSTFTWNNDSNNLTLNQIATNYAPVFGSLITVKKLCKPQVHLSKHNMNVIPYLVSILNKNLKVVRQIQPDKHIYALVSLTNSAKDTINFDKFDAAMWYYRNYNVARKNPK